MPTATANNCDMSSSSRRQRPKVSYIMSKRSKIMSDRFSEKLNDNVHEKFRKYKLSSNEHNFSLEKTLAYLHELYEGEAKQQYYSTFITKSKSYEDAKKI